MHQHVTELRSVREHSPFLPPLEQFNLWCGYILIITSIPTVNDRGEEGVGGNGCSTTADTIAYLAEQVKPHGMEVVEVIHLGDRMRILSEKIQKQSQAHQGGNDENRLAASIPALQKEAGKKEDRRAFDETIEAAQAGKLVILEAKFGALLAGWLAEVAPTIPITVLGLDCSDEKASQRKRDVTLARAKKGEVVMLSDTRRARVDRAHKDNDAIKDLYGRNVPGIGFTREKQLEAVTEIIDTTDADVEQTAYAALMFIMTRLNELHTQYQIENRVPYTLAKALQNIGAEKQVRGFFSVYDKVKAKLRNLFSNRSKINIAH